MSGPYRASIQDPSPLTRIEWAEFPTLTAVKRWAQSNSDWAAHCYVNDAAGKLVAGYHQIAGRWEKGG